MSYNDLRKGRFSQLGHEYFVTTVVRDREPIFADLYSARAFIRILQETEKLGLGNWLAWVLMPDHFHGLVSLRSEADLSDLMKRVKGASGRVLNKRMNRGGSFWQPGFYDHGLRKDEDRLGIARYIVANPLRSGLAKRAGDYPHWDSVWL